MSKFSFVLKFSFVSKFSFMDKFSFVSKLSSVSKFYHESKISIVSKCAGLHFLYVQVSLLIVSCVIDFNYPKSPSIICVIDGLFKPFFEKVHQFHVLLMDFLNHFPKSPSITCFIDGLYIIFSRKSINFMCY